jgi:lysophospholipase L1-like esterase
VVLAIGTNNLALLHQTPDQVARGVAADVAAVHAASPGSRVVVLSLFPRVPGPGNPPASQLLAVNARLAALPGVTYLNVYPAFLNPDGTPNRPLFKPDGVHLTVAGYQTLADAVAVPLEQILAHLPSTPVGVRGFVAPAARA